MANITALSDILKTLGISELNPGACFAPGQWSRDSTTAVFASTNPANNQPLAQLQSASAQDYETVLASASQAFLQWRCIPAPARGEVIRLIANKLRQHKEVLGQLVTLETGKLLQEGYGEVQEMIDIADFAVGQSRMLYGKTMHSERPRHRMYEQWHPLGITGVITAFNFPVAVWAWNAFIAAIAGNSVIWKPSPQAPLCALAVQHLCNAVLKAGDYPAIFTLLIEHNNQLVQRLVNDPQLPLISFTGSTAVGRKVAQQVAKRLGRSLLELSGNNAIIVDETADLQLALPSIVFGSVGTTGQRCTTSRRLFVHQSRYQELTDKLVHAYQQIHIGDPLDAAVLMGPLISPEAVQTFVETIKTIKALGGEILIGGEVIEGSGNFVRPTIVRGENNWPIVQQETFAPILYVMPYENLQQAIKQQNAVSQGLSSALFTRDLSHAERYLSATGSDCGIANINIGTSGAEIGGAFGGEKDTGGGREAGSDAWKAYMRRQTNTINWGTDTPLAQGIQFKPGD